MPVEAQTIQFEVPSSTEVTLPSTTGDIRDFQERLLHVIEPLWKQQGRDRDAFATKFGLEEALVNAIKHGNGMDPEKVVHIVVCIEGTREDLQRLTLTITDEGEGFDPKDVPDPTAIENLDRPCGRGVMLMKHYFSEVTYNEKGNQVTVTRNANSK